MFKNVYSKSNLYNNTNKNSEWRKLELIKVKLNKEQNSIKTTLKWN